MIDEIEIQGMGCDHCITAVREALAKVDGVTVEEVEIGRARVRVDGASTESLDEAVRSAGYEPVTHKRQETA